MTPNNQWHKLDPSPASTQIYIPKDPNPPKVDIAALVERAKELVTAIEDKEEAKRMEEEEKKQKESYRHTVPESDSLVQILLNLEERYKDNEEELKLVKAIIVHEDTFEMGWQEFKRVNEEAPKDEKNWISKNSKWATLWKYQAAMDHTEKQIWWKCLTDLEWEAVCDAIPWKSDNEHSRNAIAIFGLLITGFIHPVLDLIYEDNEEYVWSSYPNGSFEAFYRCFRRDNDQVKRGSVYQAFSFSLRLAKDKK